MTALGAVLVVALVLLMAAPFIVAISILGVLLVAGTVAAAWCTLRFLALDEEGDPPCLPSRRCLRTKSSAAPPRAAGARSARSDRTARSRRSVAT